MSNVPKKVIGVELVEAAVIDARKNVQLNEDKLGRDKCEFMVGKAEEVLPEILKNGMGEKVIGVVDPPR